MSVTHTFNTIILDIGDVRFTELSNTETSISPKTLRRIRTCSTWFDYERGKLCETDCYDKLSSEFSLSPDEIRGAFIAARKSFHIDDDLIHLVRKLKEESDGTLGVLAMVNISVTDFDALRKQKFDWDIFDRIFISGEAGERTLLFCY